MSTLAVALEQRERRVPAGTALPLYFVVLSLPLWWVLGAAYFIWPLLTLPLLLSLVLRGGIRVPPRFGLWLLFLGWSLVSVVELHRQLSLLLFAYRGSLYVSATILFLYVFNASRDQISDRTIITVLALFWCEVVIGGFLGVLFPRVSFHTPVESVVPQAFLQDQTAYYFVHPAFSEVMTFLGYPVGRPKVLFAYSNQWGAALAVLTPFAIAVFRSMSSGPRRKALAALLVLSVIPVVVSLNRGLWLSLAVGIVYVLVRFARQLNFRAVAVTAGGLVAAVVLVLSTPLGGLVQDRFNSKRSSNETRLSVYQETIKQVRQSPLIGYGSPRASSDDPNLPHVGTQGQLFTVVYSYGIPAFIFFAGWFLYTFLRSLRRGGPGRFWTNVALLILLVEMPFYNYMPAPLHIAMIAAALAWRDIVDPEIGPEGT